LPCLRVKEDRENRMLNGIKNRVVRLEQFRGNPDVTTEQLARLERARERVGLPPRKPLTDAQEAELKGKSIGQMILLFRKWKSQG